MKNTKSELNEVQIKGWKSDILHLQTKSEIDSMIKRFEGLKDKAKTINEAKQYEELIAFAKSRRFMAYG